jgi:hypothetical protein
MRFKCSTAFVVVLTVAALSAVTASSASATQCQSGDKGEGSLYTWCVGEKDLSGEAAFTMPKTFGAMRMKGTSGIEVACAEQKAAEGDLLQEESKEPKISHLATLSFSECVVLPATQEAKCKIAGGSVTFNGGPSKEGLVGEAVVLNGFEAMKFFPAKGTEFGAFTIENREGQSCAVTGRTSVDGHFTCELPEREKESVKRTVKCTNASLEWGGRLLGPATITMEKVMELKSGKMFSLRQDAD